MCTICLTSEARLLLTADEGIESEPTWKEFSLRHGEGISFSGVLIADGQDEIAVFLMSDHQEGVTQDRKSVV